MMRTLLIIDDDAVTYKNEVARKAPPHLLIEAAVDDKTARHHIAAAEIILGRPSLVAPLLHRAKSLRWVQSTFAGIEPFCQPGLRTDYLLTGVKNVFGSLMSEYVFLYILARERSIFKTFGHQQEKVWRPLQYRGLENLTLGIAGLGSIGQHLAQTAHHFKMRVFGMKRTDGPVPFVDRCFTPANKQTFLERLDYLVLCLPDTPETSYFMKYQDFHYLKREAVLINVGRGSSVNQEDLIQALKANLIAGAILDVFEEEPLAADNPLWGMENVIITPHNSAFSFPQQICDIFSRNYLRFTNGQPLLYQVDFNRGY